MTTNINVVDDFYSATSILLDVVTKKLKADENEAAYLTVLDAASENTLKSLVTDAIPKYFKYFPKLQERALDRHLDLCEDDDPKVRKEAIRLLPMFSKDSPQFSTKVADVLFQLLQTDSKEEETIVKLSLTTCWQQRPIATATAMAQQLTAGFPEVRTHIFEFLSPDFISQLSKSPSILKASMDPDSVNHFILAMKRLMGQGELDGSQVSVLVKVMETVLGVGGEVGGPVGVKSVVSGDVTILESALEVLVLGIEATGLFSPENANSVTVLAECIRSSQPYYRRGAKATALVQFMLERVWTTDASSRFVNEKKRLQAFRVGSDAVAKGVSGDVAPAVYQGVVLALLDQLSHTPAVPNDYPFPLIECLLFNLYELHLQHPSHFENQDPTLNNALRQLYMSSQTKSSELARNQHQKPASTLQQHQVPTVQDIRAVSNVLTLCKELMKPAKARTRIWKFLLSWHKETVTVPTVVAPVATAAAPTVPAGVPVKGAVGAVAGVKRPSGATNGAAAGKPVVKKVAVAVAGNGGSGSGSGSGFGVVGAGGRNVAVVSAAASTAGYAGVASSAEMGDAKANGNGLASPGRRMIGIVGGAGGVPTSQTLQASNAGARKRIRRTMTQDVTMGGVGGGAQQGRMKHTGSLFGNVLQAHGLVSASSSANGVNGKMSPVGGGAAPSSSSGSGVSADQKIVEVVNVQPSRIVVAVQDDVQNQPQREVQHIPPPPQQEQHEEQVQEDEAMGVGESVVEEEEAAVEVAARATAKKGRGGGRGGRRGSRKRK
ncbi:Apoptosis inhibitor 5 [Blyttiomyces sp. JEL0837]|nr:Apoptosis inhibitor 5 [Blyttiomyces sp. JEL0837]